MQSLLLRWSKIEVNSKNTKAHQAFMQTTEEVFIVFTPPCYLSYYYFLHIQSIILENGSVLQQNPSQKPKPEFSDTTRRQKAWSCFHCLTKVTTIDISICAALGVGHMVATRAGLQKLRCGLTDHTSCRCTSWKPSLTHTHTTQRVHQAEVWTNGTGRPSLSDQALCKTTKWHTWLTLKMKNTALQELVLFTTPRLLVERIKLSHMHFPVRFNPTDSKKHESECVKRW